MKGYKLVDDGIVNQYNKKYILNQEYILNGKLKYSKNGFHYSTYPEETLRFADFKDKNLLDDFIICEVIADGEIECGDDYPENIYADSMGLYASSKMTIIRVLSRSEVFNIILNSNNPFRIRKYIMYVKLKEEEIIQIRNKYRDFETNAYIEFYQYRKEDAFKRTLK